MGCISFPSQEKKLATLEANLNKGNLTLGKLEEIEHKIVREMAGKTGETAMRLFSLIEEKKKPLIQAQLEQFKTAPISDKIKKLTHLIPYLPTEEVDGLVDKIKFEASLDADPKVEKAVEHLLFTRKNPILRDLEEDFAHEAEDLADLVQKVDSLTPMVAILNSRQMAEVRRYT